MYQDSVSIAGELFSAHRERNEGGGGGGYLQQALEQSHVKAWASEPFTADLCESILPAGASYGDFSSTFKNILNAIFPLDLTEAQRASVQKTVRALERSENIFRRREQHLAWGLPFHMSRVVDETCRQLHGSNIGDIHIFPFVFAGSTVCVVNHITNSAFSLAIICVNPTESTYLPFSADKPPKLQVQSILEVHNIPKKKITSEAFWAIELTAGAYDDSVVATHIVPWLNNKPIADLVRDTRDPAFATGSKNDSGNVWKSFIHAFKYIARTTCNASKAEIKGIRVMIKKFFLERALEDLKSVDQVDHSTRLIIRSALQNSSLCLARNAECLSEDLFHSTRRLVDSISDKMKSLPSTDEASTAPPPAINMDDGWDKLQHPEQFPFMECLRRLENVDHFAGTAVEQPRYVPVNFFNVPESVHSFDEALYTLDMALHVTNRIINQQAIVRRAPFMIVAFLTRVILDVLPSPLGPRSRIQQKRKCLWHPDQIRYGQQIHTMNRLWNLCELFSWASFAFRSDKEFDAQRITVLGKLATISDAIIRQLACDQPSIISKHLRGFRRKAGFAPQTGRYASQTENSISYNPSVNIARSGILDYHNEVCEDIPTTNVMFPWEDGWNMCKATTSMLRQMASVEGLPMSAVSAFFPCEEGGGPKVIPGRYYNEFKIYRDLYIVFKIMMGARGKLPSCTNCMTCCTPSPAVTVEMKGGQMTLRVKWMHSDRFAKAVHLRFPSYAVASKFTTPFEAQTEDDILHIKNLPNFDDAMGQRDSELLLSYLTAPYLRIPLVLNFFATEDRVSCLSNSTVRNVLESVLFEPCTFLPHTLENQVPEQVPSENPALIATAQGILFNETQFSPKGLVDPLIRLVNLGREMDAGTVQNTQVVELILFLVRLASRVDNFLTKYVDLAKEYKKSNGEKIVRGLHFGDDAVAEAQAARAELHKITIDVFVPMMESWLNELIEKLETNGVIGTNVRSQSRQIDAHTMRCARLYAHILTVLRNIDPETELTANTASLILSSIIFITCRYNPGVIYSSILVHEAEIFDSVELQRRNIARWLQAASPQDLAFVNDSVVRVATSTGKRAEGHSYAWGFVAGQDCVGRYTRVDNIRANASDSKKPQLLDTIVEAFGEDDTKHSLIRSDITCLNEGDHDVEVNIQTFSLTFKAAHLVALPAPIAQSADLQTVFSHSAKLKSQIPSMQCAVVQDAENRMWVRLVGQEMDVQRWGTGDPRIPLPEQDMRFFPDDLSPSEEWIFKLVEPVREMYFVRGFMAPPIFLLLPKEKVASHQSVITIAAVCSRTGQKLKEVVAFKDFNVVHVYDIISIGRRWYRKLLYTSNAHFCLRALQPAVADRFQLWKKNFRHAGGDFDPDTRSEPADSIVILRHPTHPQNISKAIETFLPARILWGLLPDVLLEKYEFWQDPDDNIRGYPKKSDDSSSSSGGGSDNSGGNPNHILWMHWRELNFDPMCSYHGSQQVAYKVIRFAKKSHAPKVSERAVLTSQKWEQPDEEDDELARMRTNTGNNNDDNDKPQGLSDDENDVDDDEEDEHQRKQFERMGMFRQASAVQNLDGEHDEHRQGSIKKIKPKKEVASIEDLDMLLINLMYAREGTPLHSLAKLLSRIEVMSHILCYTTQVDYDFTSSQSVSSNNNINQTQDKSKKPHHPLSIDLIQLPRLKLTFAAKIDADGSCRVYSLDHAHLFVSNLRPTLVTQQLIQGMPHSIILGDSCDNLSILVPALNVVRPMIQSAPFSTELVVNRSNKPWYQKLDTRYYLYPVHVSLSFLFTPTLASALYLIALRFLHCEYEDVFRLASTIGTDMSLTAEEEQNFRLLAARDNRHEAIACRVKIGLLVADSPVDLLWYLPNETARMIRSYSSIGLSCRLNVTEERRLLQICRQMMSKVKIVEDVVKTMDMDMLLRFAPNLIKKRNPSAAATAPNPFGGEPSLAVPFLGNIYAGLGSSEVKAVKEMFSDITTRLRNQLDLRINREEVTRIFLMYWSQRKSPLPDFYRCLLLNRDSYLRAEAESVDKAEKEGTEPQPVTCKMLIPERDQDELWAYYRDYDVLSCKLPSAQEANKNDADRNLTFSNKIDYFYCGQAVRKNGCRCKHCEDDICGPETGCPCLACEKWNKKRLPTMRYLPKKVTFSSQRIMSFFDASTWIDDVISNFVMTKSWRKNLGANVHPTILATSASHCSTLRVGSSNFMRLYELLTGHTKCRIGSADSGKDMVHLLFPLCHEARRPESALGHLMHYLVNNPQVLPKLPKTKNFTKDDTPEKKLEKIYAAIFQHAANDCRYPPQIPPHLLKGGSSKSTTVDTTTSKTADTNDDENQQQDSAHQNFSLNDERTIIATVNPRPSKRSDPRVPILATRLLPTLSDTDCSQRKWGAFDLSQLEIAEKKEETAEDKKKKKEQENNNDDNTTTNNKNKIQIHVEGVDIDNVDEREQLETVTEEMRLHLRTQPLLSVVPPGLVRLATRTDLGDEPISDKMPFDLRKHEAARTTVAQKMISRLEQDLQDFAKKENSSKVPRLEGLCPASKASSLLRAGGKPVIELRQKLESLIAALTKLREDDIKFTGAAFRVIERTINAMPVRKGSSRAEAIMHLRRLADQEAKMNLTYIISSLCSSSAESHLVQLNPFLTPETIEAVMNLSTTTLLRANRVGHANRASEMARELVNLLKKVEHETSTSDENNTTSSSDQQTSSGTMNNLVLLVEQKSDSLASMLITKRVYIEDSWKFDPRFLLFEYTWNIVLRARQRQIIDEIHKSVVDGAKKNSDSNVVKDNSVVKQMIMGAGKTTVVGPLLAMMLADSKNLVMQVVPPALLDFTRSVLRATFSTVLQKQIFCFIADRASDIDSEVIGKFVHAKESRGIVVTTPSSIKSVFLKMVEGMDRIEDIARKPYPGQDKEVRDVRRLVKVWKNDAILVLDEVDMILHTLKSELNFPVGQKHEIDFAPLRWKLPIHLFDAVFYATTGHLSTGVKETPDNLRLLQGITDALEEGLATNCLQGTPHTTLLNLEFYETKLRDLFAKWGILFLKANHFNTGSGENHLSDEDLIRYVTKRPSKKEDAKLNEKVERLEEDHIKTLNLIYDWVVSFLPHCLQKIDRVSFGIMNNDDMSRAREEHPSMPKSRFVTAIPFIGKDLPSPSSEFAHPDVVIGLTILAYRYEGLRSMDYTDVMRQIFAAVEKEVGRFSQRRTNIMYTRWVQAAGGRLISSFSYTDAEKAKEAKKKKQQEKREREKKDRNSRRSANIHVTSSSSALVQAAEKNKDGDQNTSNSTLNPLLNDAEDDDDEVGMQPSESMAMTRAMSGAGGANSGSNMGSRAASGEENNNNNNNDDADGGMGSGMGAPTTSLSTRDPNQIDILPLRLMKQANREESNKLFKLFKRCPEVIHWYLCNTVFPNFMRHQLTKLSASGQELGGNILFQRRIGFSGTPSDLLPKELGSCEYEAGTDGKLLHTLTNPQIMSVTRVERDWTVRLLLDFIGNANPPYHALIDTGALITGMSNLQVAQYLLKHGLPSMEGVVFLDELDRKMILVRATGRVLKLAECGIPKVKRFAIYDQVHTTGMDIEHTPNAVAVQTLGKDMTFRDFSQGAYRMRGIGQGQKVDVLIIPEVYDLIQRTVKDIKHKSIHGPSSHESSSGSSSISPSHQEMLLDVSTWLLVNSIRSEHIQHNQLCLQTIANVWRKEAFRQLCEAEDRDEFLLPSSNTIAEAGGTERKTQVRPDTLLALNVFRESVNYSVATDVPQPRMFSEAVQTMVDEHTTFIVGDTSTSVVSEICNLTKREDEVDNPVIDVQMVQEQEEEREQEEEKQKEHEIEMEKFVDLAYSRDDEAPTPWALTSLRDTTLASQFYPLSDFRLHKRRPLRFPDSIMVSRNFFNPKWSGSRRIKNAIVSLEWLPDADDVASREMPDLDYGCLEDERQQAAIESTLTTLRMLEGPFSAELVRDFAKIALGQNNKELIVSNEDLWQRLGSELKQLDTTTSTQKQALVSPEVIKAACNLFLKLLRSNQLRQEERGRYSVLVTLSEAETLRRVIHLKKISGEDFLKSSSSENNQQQQQQRFRNRNTQVALRMIPANNRVLDQTPGYNEGPNNFQRDRNYQSIRFFDGDLHYLDSDLNLLLRAIHSSPQRMRQTFFLQTLSCRRRARQRWENSPVALAFNLQDAFSWLHQKTLGLCLRRALERRDLHLADAFVAINNSQSGKITADEVWGAFMFCGMSNTTASDVLDFVQVADTHHEGSIHYSDFLSMLTGSSEIDEESLPGAGGGKDDKSRLPTIEPLGAQELTDLIVERAKTRRSEEKDASQQMASEEQAIREEIERETIKEELTLIQTSQNPRYDENKKSLCYSLHEAKPPKLAQFFGHVDPALVEDTPDDTVKSGGGIEATNHPELAFETTNNKKQQQQHQDPNAVDNKTLTTTAAATSETSSAIVSTTTTTTSDNKKQDSSSTTKKQTEEDADEETTKQSDPFFGLAADGGMRLVARSIKLLNQQQQQEEGNNNNKNTSSSSSSILTNYGLHMEFRVPMAKLVGRKKVKLRKFSEVLGPQQTMTAVQFNTRTWCLNPSTSRASSKNDENDEGAIMASLMQSAFELSDSDQDKKGDGGSDSDEDGLLASRASARRGGGFSLNTTFGSHAFVKRMKMLNYIFREADPQKPNRLRRLKLNSSFEEHKSGKRINTTLGGDSYEWMKISKPIPGWVVFQVNGIQMMVRERISINLTSEGRATIEGVFPKDNGIADLPPTSFAQKKEDDDSSDDDNNSGGSWWSGWDAYMSFFGNMVGGGNDEADDDSDDGLDKEAGGLAVDLGDIGDLMSEIRRKKELKAGDKVRRNPEDWSHGDKDGGEGVVGRVIKTEQQGNVSVQWPNGNKTTCLWGQGGKFELIKVASKGGDGEAGEGEDEEDKYFGRDVDNISKWSAVARTPAATGKAGQSNRCSICQQAVSLVNLENGWMKCNQCPAVHLCMKCFRAQEHGQHTFTDMQVLSEVLKETTILPESHVRIRSDIREPQFGWGSAPRDGTPGVVRTIDEEAGSCIVNFGEGTIWTGLMSELDLLDARHEVLSTSWLGNLFMMTSPLDRRRHFKRLTHVVDESLALPVVASKFAVGDRVKAKMVPTLAKYHAGEIRAALAGSKYVVAFDDGHVNQDVPEVNIEPFPFKINQKVRILRLGTYASYPKGLPLGVRPGSTGEIATIANYVNKTLRCVVKVRTGVSISRLTFLESEIEPVQPTQWFFRRVNEDNFAAKKKDNNNNNDDDNDQQQQHQYPELPVPASNVLSLERAFSNGKPTADLFFKNETYQARLEEMMLYSTKTNTVAAVLRREPDEPFELQKDRTDFFDGRWHVLSVLLNKKEPKILVDGENVELTFNVQTATAGMEQEAPSSDDDESDDDLSSFDTDDSDGFGGYYTRRKNRAMQEKLPSELRPKKAVKQGKKKSSSKKINDDDDVSSDDSDEDIEEIVRLEKEKQAREEAKKTSQEKIDGAAAASSSTNNNNNENNEKPDTNKNNNNPDETAAAMVATKSAELLNEKKNKLDKQKREKAKLVPPLARTAGNVMQIDVREPITVLPFNEATAATHRQRFGSTFPNRYISEIEIGWSKNSGSEASAIQKFKELDSKTLWVCSDCEEKNSRLTDVCSKCNKDRFFVDGKIKVREKVRAVTHRSKEASDLRKRLHAKLRQQCQKQLEQMDEQNANISGLL